MRPMKKTFLISVLVLVALFLLVREWSEPAYQQELESAFGELLAGIEEAEGNLTSLAAMAPPRDERRLVAGYNYLLGHLVRIVASEADNNPENPHFERAITSLSKWTGDNPDNAYLTAPIDGNFSYRVTGSVPWYRGSDAKALRDIPQAPGLVIFQTTTLTIGDTGSLDELVNCRNQTFASLDSFELQIEPDGRFEILLSPERPPGHEGNWLATRGRLACETRDGETTWQEKVAGNFVIREIFIDWNEERPLDLDIVRLGFEGVPPRRASTQRRVEQLRAIGEKLPNQVNFWNWVMEIGLEAWGDRNLDGELRLPRNAVNPPAPPFLAGGTAGTNQLYASGMFALAEDEALILEVEIPVMPDYLGFHLGDAWMQSLDQANYVSSRNQSQLDFESGGNTYLVIAHRDPGVANWIDTTGLETGQMIFRFWYADAPEESFYPGISARKVGFDDVAAELTSRNARRVGVAERRSEVAERQRHMRQRFRQY